MSETSKISILLSHRTEEKFRFLFKAVCAPLTPSNLRFGVLGTSLRGAGPKVLLREVRRFVAILWR